MSKQEITTADNLYLYNATALLDARTVDRLVHSIEQNYQQAGIGFNQIEVLENKEFSARLPERTT